MRRGSLSSLGPRTEGGSFRLGGLSLTANGVCGCSFDAQAVELGQDGFRGRRINSLDGVGYDGDPIAAVSKSPHCAGDAIVGRHPVDHEGWFVPTVPGDDAIGLGV